MEREKEEERNQAGCYVTIVDKGGKELRRVVLAAGDYDCARPTMQLAAARLNAGGLESRYVSTGKIWHQLPADLESILRDAIAWIRSG